MDNIIFYIGAALAVCTLVLSIIYVCTYKRRLARLNLKLDLKYGKKEKTHDEKQYNKEI